MTYDWSPTGHKLPPEALRKSRDLKPLSPAKARECRVSWERAEAGLEPFHVIVERVVRKVRDANS